MYEVLFGWSEDHKRRVSTKRNNRREGGKGGEGRDGLRKGGRGVGVPTATTRAVLMPGIENTLHAVSALARPPAESSISHSCGYSDWRR